MKNYWETILNYVKMRKKIIFGISITVIFVFVMFINVNFGHVSNNRDIKLENIEALACYSAEDQNGSTMECCAPWDTICWMIMPGYFVPGTWGPIF